MKKLISFILILLLSLPLCACKRGTVTVCDSDGTVLATVSSVYDIPDITAAPYIRLCLAQAAEAVTESRLFSGGVTVHTNYDADMTERIAESYKEAGDVTFGASVVDTKGRIVAVFSSDNAAHATTTVPPYSAFKPLSVYAPAVDKGVITWSSVYDDSPVKQVNGSDWPSNPTGKYKNRPITVAEGVRESLNTTAVRVYTELGMQNSLKFLSRYGITLEYEAARDPDDVIGNIALGYLHHGVSTVDMAGYYSAFINNGIYIQPSTVSEITDSDGSVIYTHVPRSSQVMKPATAAVMSALLRGVVRGGTGVNAQTDGVEVGGKTGTGELGNWFCGFTPEYSIAVFHGTETEYNNAAAMFSDIASGITHSVTRLQSAGLTRSIYCVDSGAAATERCLSREQGYYAGGSVPEHCTVH